MNYKRLALIIAISISISLLGYFVYKFYVDGSHVDADPMTGVPQNYTFLLKFDNIEDFENTFLTDSNIFSAQLTPFFSDTIIEKLKVVLGNEKLKSWMIENLNAKFVLSAHFQGINSFPILFTFSKTKNFSFDGIEDAFGKDSKVEDVKFGEVVIKKLSIKHFLQPVFMAEANGLLSISFDQLLIEKVLNHLKNKQFITNDELVKKAIKVEGEGAGFSMYLNIGYLYRQLGSYTNGYSNNLKWLTSLGNIGVLDFKFEENKLLASGFLLSNDSTKTLNDIWRGQSTREINSFSIIPQNSVFLIVNTFSDFRSLRYAMQSQSTIINNLDIDVTLEVIPWVKDEAGVFALDGKIQGVEQRAYGFVRVTDKLEAMQKLEAIKAKNMDAIIAIDTLTYRGFELKNLGINNFFPELFGEEFKIANGEYFTFIDDYLVFGGSIEALSSLIDNYLVGRVLKNSKSFGSLLRGLSKQSNIFYYFNPAKFDFFESFISPEVYRAFEQNNFPVKMLNGIGIQLTFENQGIYVNLAVESGKGESVIIDDGWESAIDAQVYLQPKVIVDVNSGESNILVFDIENNLYLLGLKGDIKWKIPLMEKPLSEVFQVDYNQDGQMEFVFNTRNYIFMVDINGNRVGKFPMKLPLASEGGMSVMDYDNNGNYRFMLPLDDKKIYNFNLNLQNAEGWRQPKITAKTLTPLPYFRLQDKDVILIVDTIGNVKFANRKGEERFVASNAFTNNHKTGFFKNGSYLITTDLLGRIVKLDNTGKVEKIQLKEFSKNHEFSITDFNNDGSNDYVFVDGHYLYVFNESKEEIYNKNFDFEISRLTTNSISSSDSLKIVLRNDEDKSIILIKFDGNMVERKDIIANDRFYLYKATKSNQLRLITVNNRILGNFLIN